MRRDAVRDARERGENPGRLGRLAGEMRVYVGDAAPADDRDEVRGQDDNREAIDERAGVTRVVEEHVTYDPPDNPRSCDRQAQQFDAAASDRGDLHHRKPRVSPAGEPRRRGRGEVRTVRRESRPIGHGVELTKYGSRSPRDTRRARSSVPRDEAHSLV
jgi:hypothetical protein